MTKHIKQIFPLSIIKEMDASEFNQLAISKPFLIRRSKYIFPKVGSGQLGKFLVELENEAGFKIPRILGNAG